MARAETALAACPKPRLQALRHNRTGAQGHHQEESLLQLSDMADNLFPEVAQVKAKVPRTYRRCAASRHTAESCSVNRQSER